MLTVFVSGQVWSTRVRLAEHQDAGQTPARVSVGDLVHDRRAGGVQRRREPGGQGRAIEFREGLAVPEIRRIQHGLLLLLCDHFHGTITFPATPPCAIENSGRPLFPLESRQSPFRREECP